MAVSYLPYSGERHFKLNAKPKQRSHDAISRIMDRRKHAPAINDDQIRNAREEERP